MVTATEAAEQGAPTEGVSHSWRTEEWTRAPACRYGGYRNDLMPGCFAPQYEIKVQCSDGSDALEPWWMRYRRSNGTWSSWSMIGWYQCPADQLRAAAENAWARMRITPNTIHVQPDTGWVLTTVPTIVFVDRTPRTMRTTLLGTPVTIRATASAYTWNWGDGVESVTTKPGAAYPNQTVSHTYLHREGPVTIRLTTSWRGSYSTDGGATWRSAPGTAYTTSTPITVTVYNPHGHRVDCDLVGNCVSGADGPSDET
ncbi:MAG: PKD domain-containing protein [Demequinaceae bacterium]|nr:PKD domain-containing protein [Demequinaceae bacterium]